MGRSSRGSLIPLSFRLHDAVAPATISHTYVRRVNNLSCLQLYDMLAEYIKQNEVTFIFG